jgi:hypothetical protein
MRLKLGAARDVVRCVNGVSIKFQIVVKRENGWGIRIYFRIFQEGSLFLPINECIDEASGWLGRTCVVVVSGIRQKFEVQYKRQRLMDGDSAYGPAT